MAALHRILLGIAALATAVLSAVQGAEDRSGRPLDDESRANAVFRALWIQIPSIESSRERSPTSRGFVGSHVALWPRGWSHIRRVEPERTPEEASTTIAVRHVRRILRMDSDEPPFGAAQA